MAVLRQALSSAKRTAMNALPDSAAAFMRSMRPTVSGQIESLQTGVAEARRGLGEFRRARVFQRALSEPIDEDLVVWESFGGNGALCSPAALFREVVDAPDLKHLSHVWMVKRDVIDAGEGLVGEFRSHPRVRFIVYRSPEYFGTLERAGRLVNNATFPAEFVKRPDQLYLNTWHGTPLKRMGYDEPDGTWAARNVLRNFLSADYLLSSGDYMTRQMYRGAYRLSPVFRGAVIEDGFPRVDVQFSTVTGREPGRPRTVLYAPTWRGGGFSTATADARELATTVAHLRGLEALRGWSVRVKVHQSVFRLVAQDPQLADALIPDSVPTNEVLAATDLLITDFSSIFFDALATKIPIVFHAEDFDQYSATRGTYIDPTELPGPVAKSRAELADAVTRALGEDGDDRSGPSDAMRAQWVGNEDGAASGRIADLFFRGREDAVRRIVRFDGDSDRTSLVIHLGGLKPNGISSSALNLLTHLDRSRYDITVVFPVSTQPDRISVRQRIPDDVRVLAVHGGLTRLPLAASYTRMLDRGVELADDRELPDEELWQHEWRRIAGDAEFDIAIDFSGYSAKWARLMTLAGARRTLLWCHNDLQADSERIIDGKRPYQRTLRSVFGLMSRYDGLVSVSEPLREINRENLGRFAPADSFLVARNVINSDAILRSAGRAQEETQPHADGATATLSTDIGMNLIEHVDALLARFGADRVRSAVASRAIQTEIRTFRGAGPLFCTVGRMSPEKNHDRLLRAFAQVVDELPDARLVIVGDGPLRAALQETAAELGLSGAVHFTGQIASPAAVLTESDCFVLSSDYEGQPMVILEALVLDLPVITTAFGSAAASMPEGTGRIVERDVDALADAMLSWTDVPRGGFDPDEYTREVLAEFDRALVDQAEPIDVADVHGPMSM